MRVQRTLPIACAAALSLVVMTAQGASIQSQGGQRVGAPPPAPAPAPSGQRGRGGRGGVQVMTLTTTAWTDGGEIPARYAQAGDDLSPPLSWSGVPENVASFALIVHDLDALTSGGRDDTLHWLVWNIPAAATGLSEGVPHGPTLPDGARQISVSGPYYRGPAAPASGPPHHYVYELYALDAMLEVPAVGASPAETRAAVLLAMAGHIRGKGVLVGRYRR